MPRAERVARDRALRTGARREARRNGEVEEEDLPEQLPGEGETRVPDLSGQTARGALTRLAEAGLRGRLLGSGVVQDQLPAAGSVLPLGERVRVDLIPAYRALPTIWTSQATRGDHKEEM